MRKKGQYKEEKDFMKTKKIWQMNLKPMEGISKK